MDNRKKLISRYEKLVDKWNNDTELQEIYPEKFVEIKRKLLALKAGLPYKIYDVTKDVVSDMGAIMRDNVRVSGGMLGEINPSEYDYKTDIPLFVDRVIRKVGDCYEAERYSK